MARRKDQNIRYPKKSLVRLGERNHFYGRKHSLESIMKMKESHKGQRSRLGTKHSEETKRKIGLSSRMRFGEKSSNWKGGISKIDRRCRRIPEYREWRENVFKRDDWTCRECGANKCYVTAHHIKGFSLIISSNSIKSVADARLCIELWDVDNGLTLCETCHKKTDNYKGRGIK